MRLPADGRQVARDRVPPVLDRGPEAREGVEQSAHDHSRDAQVDDEVVPDTEPASVHHAERDPVVVRLAGAVDLVRARGHAVERQHQQERQGTERDAQRPEQRLDHVPDVERPGSAVVRRDLPDGLRPAVQRESREVGERDPERVLVAEVADLGEEHECSRGDVFLRKFA